MACKRLRRLLISGFPRLDSPIETLAAQIGSFGDCGHAAIRFNHVSESEQKDGAIPFFNGCVKICRSLVMVFQCLNQIFR